jgi:PAS domain S-box-containing protein
MTLSSARRRVEPMGAWVERPPVEPKRLSDDFLRQLMETIPAAAIVWDGREAAFVNDAALGITGYSREELRTMSPLDLIHPDSLPVALEQYRRDLAGERLPRQYELKCLTKSGEARWVDLRFDWLHLSETESLMICIATDIHDRKLAEEALRESEARSRVLYEDNPSMYFTVDTQGIVQDLNNLGASQLGYTREELIGGDALDVYHPDDREAVSIHFQALLAHPGETAVLEVRKVRKDGSEIWVEHIARATKGPDGGDVILIVCADITERHSVREELRLSQERFARFMEHLPGLAWIKDADGRYVYANEAAEAAFQTPRQKLYGHTDREIFPAEVAEQFIENDRQALASETGVQIIETLEQEDGVRHHSIVSKFPIPGPDGRSLLTGGMAIDITELRESEERLRAFAEAVPDLSLILDRDGRYVEVLGRAEDSALLYAPATEMKGKLMHEILPKAEADTFLAVVRKTLSSGTPQFLEYSMDVQSGKEWFEARTAPLNTAGPVPMVVWLARRVTERKELELENLRLREELERRAERAVGRGGSYCLTFRELTVLQLVADGKADKEAAAILGISPLTVSKHVTNILSKMKAPSRAEASARAVRERILD